MYIYYIIYNKNYCNNILENGENINLIKHEKRNYTTKYKKYDDKMQKIIPGGAINKSTIGGAINKIIPNDKLVIIPKQNIILEEANINNDSDLPIFLKIKERCVLINFLFPVSKLKRNKTYITTWS